MLSNFWIIDPTADDLARYEAGNATADESVAIQGPQRFFGSVAGYFTQQALQPLQIAILLTDSPVGNAMWIYDLMFGAVESYKWTPKEIITWSMMYWIQGPYGGARIYKEAVGVGFLVVGVEVLLADFLQEGAVAVGGFSNAYPYIHQPVSISQFPFDIQYRVASR